MTDMEWVTQRASRSDVGSRMMTIRFHLEAARKEHLQPGLRIEPAIW